MLEAKTSTTASATLNICAATRRDAGVSAGGSSIAARVTARAGKAIDS